MAEEMRIPEEMKLVEGEMLRIRVTEYNPDTGDCKIFVATNGKTCHIRHVLNQICDKFDMICIPKCAMGVAIDLIEVSPALNEEEEETDYNEE